MNFSLSALSLSLGTVLFMTALLGGRNPNQPRWANELLMSYVISPIIVGLFALGAAGLINALFFSVFPGVKDLAIAATIFICAALIYPMLGIKRKLAAYEAAEKAGKLIDGNFTHNGAGNNAKPAGVFRKAA